jgi:hypothetical protein
MQSQQDETALFDQLSKTIVLKKPSLEDYRDGFLCAMFGSKPNTSFQSGVYYSVDPSVCSSVFVKNNTTTAWFKYQMLRMRQVARHIQYGASVSYDVLSAQHLARVSEDEQLETKSKFDAWWKNTFAKTDRMGASQQQQQQDAGQHLTSQHVFVSSMPVNVLLSSVSFFKQDANCRVKRLYLDKNVSEQPFVSASTFLAQTVALGLNHFLISEDDVLDIVSPKCLVLFQHPLLVTKALCQQTEWESKQFENVRIGTAAVKFYDSCPTCSCLPTTTTTSSSSSLSSSTARQEQTVQWCEHVQVKDILESAERVLSLLLTRLSQKKEEQRRFDRVILCVRDENESLACEFEKMKNSAKYNPALLDILEPCMNQFHPDEIAIRTFINKMKHLLAPETIQERSSLWQTAIPHLYVVEEVVNQEQEVEMVFKAFGF